MGTLSAIDILYIIFLIGSLAFGLEAMLIGLGGKLMVMYRRRRTATLGAALSIGIAVVALAAVTSMVFMLEPIYFAVIVLAYAFVAGRVVKIWGERRFMSPAPPTLPQTSEREMTGFVKERGYGNLVIKPESHKKSAHRKKRVT